MSGSRQEHTTKRGEAGRTSAADGPAYRPQRAWRHALLADTLGAGVGEYWIVDPDQRRVTVYARSEEGLTELKSGHGEITSPLAGGPVATQQIW